MLISSSHRGAYPDDADARPFFALATELDIPVFMHPPSVGFGEERMREFRLASSVGRPFDACLALARLIVNGVFEEFPRLKFVASHLGGGICEIIGRMDYAYELRDDPFILGPYGPPLHITRKPSDYLRGIYFDTVCYHAPAVECAIKTVGADRLIFGTDSPMLVALKQRGLDLVREPRPRRGRQGEDLGRHGEDAAQAVGSDLPAIWRRRHDGDAAMIGSRALPLLCACALMLAAHAAAAADAVADFYRGKTISLYVGFPPGGGYDLYARVFAPYFTRHIPGNPTIVIKSMLGGSGMKAAGYMSTVTPQDGTSLGVFLDALTLGKVLGGPGEFDPVKLTWIGRIVSTATVSVVWHTSPVQTIEEAKHRELADGRHRGVEHARTSFRPRSTI